MRTPIGKGYVASEMNDALDLPSLFRAVVLREHRDAFAHACAIAAEEGGGTLVWVRRFDTVEFAVVLEPDEPLRAARRALYGVMNAAGDALASNCPPEKPIGFTWPDTITLDGGIIGGARLAWPENAAEDEVPEWIVAGVVLRSTIPLIASTGKNSSPFDLTHSKGTSLEIEGFEMIEAAILINSFARHLMLYADQWQETGFKAVAERYLTWLPEDKTVQRGIDGNGDLLVRTLKTGGAKLDEPRRQDLVAALAKPQWLDPDTGNPWL